MTIGTLKMINLAMQRKIKSRKAIDISSRPLTPDGYYILDKFANNKDYCDSVSESWIWSIGRRINDGLILASTASDLYQNDDYECLFLR